MSELKASGDAAFRANKWTEAIEFYTQAIDASPSLKTTAVLYCNRAACYTNLCEFDLAIFDGWAALRLDPTISKGEMRQAEAYVRSHNFGNATQSYKRAIALAESKEIETRYKKASAQVKILAAVVPFDPTTETSKRKMIPRERLKTLEDNGLVLDLDNAKGTYGVASDLCTNAFELLNSIPEARHEVDDRILDWLLMCLETDHYAFSIPDELERRLMSYLSDCLTACDALVFASCEHDANVVLHYFQGEVLKTGYRLKTLIVVLLLLSIAKDQGGRHDVAVKTVVFLDQLMTAASTIFGPDIALRIADGIFAPKSSRVINVITLDILVANYFKGISTQAVVPSSLSVSNMESMLRSSAESLINNCKSGDQAWKILTHYDRPLSEAYMHLGSITIAQASVRGNTYGRAVYYNYELAAKAVKHYRNAIKHLPSDSFLLGQLMYDELEAVLRVGGIVTVQDMFSKTAAAERAFLPADKWAGSCPRQFPSRVMVQNLCTIFRNRLADQMLFLPNAEMQIGFTRLTLTKTIKAAPNVVNNERFGYDCIGKVEMNYDDTLPGSISLGLG